jgi:hypothetical protein
LLALIQGQLSRRPPSSALAKAVNWGNKGRATSPRAVPASAFAANPLFFITFISHFAIALGDLLSKRA